jgi:hypothetical protein
MWHIASVTNMDQFGHNRRHSGRARTPAARQLAQPSTCPSVRPNYPSLCPGIYGISEVNRRLLGAGLCSANFNIRTGSAKDRFDN